MGQEQQRAPVSGGGWAWRRRRLFAASGAAGIAVGGLALYVREVPLVVGQPEEAVAGGEVGDVRVSDDADPGAPGTAEDAGPEGRARKAKVARWMSSGVIRVGRAQEPSTLSLRMRSGVSLFGEKVPPPWSNLPDQSLAVGRWTCFHPRPPEGPKETSGD